MRILFALLLSAFAAYGAVTGAVQADSTKHVTQPSGFWAAQPSDSTFVGAVRSVQTNSTGVQVAAGDNIIIVSNGLLRTISTSSTAITGAVASVQGKAGIVSLTTSDIPEGTNRYWTTVISNSLTGSLWQFVVAYAQPASGNLSNAASASQNGYLTSGDWSTFNGKISGNQTITLSGDATGSGATSISVVGVNAKNATNYWGRLNATNLPALTGDVTSSAGSAATTLANIPAISGANLTGFTSNQIPNLNASKLVDGTLIAGVMPALTGDITTSAGAVATTLKTSPTIVTPTISSFVNATHTHQNAAGGGTLDAAAIGSGTVATARLGSGTANSSTFLRGDQTYATPSGSGDGVQAGNNVWTGSNFFSGPVVISNGTAITVVSNLDVTGWARLRGVVTNDNLTASMLMGSDANKSPSSVNLSGDVTTSGGLATTLKTSPTIVTPTIASFVNATHSHQNAAGGGTLDGAAIASGSIADARLGNAVLNTRTITMAVGSASLTTSAGAQDLSANRTWTLDTAQNIQTSASPTFAGLTVNGSGNANIGGFIIATNGYQGVTNTVAANSTLAMGLEYDIVTSGTVTLGISTFSGVPTSTYSFVEITITSSGTATLTNHPSIHMSDGLTSRGLSNSCHIAFEIIPRFRTNGALVQFP